MLDVDEPNENTDDRDHLCEHVAEIIQLLLQGCWLRYLRSNAFMDVTDGGGTSSQNDHSSGMAGDDSRPREQHIDLILLNRLRILDGVGILADALALARQDGLIHLEGIALDRKNPAISWNSVSNRH